jgi:hypothetical protein
MLSDIAGYLHGEDGLADARLPKDDAEITFEYDVWVERDQWRQQMSIFDTLVHCLDMEASAINRLTI